jgi:hypothetical protein
VIDLGTGDLAGFLILPPAQVRLQALGVLRLVDATFQIAPAFVSRVLRYPAAPVAAGASLAAAARRAA